MEQKIGYFSFLVRDYDEAISYFVDKLRFKLLEDTDMGGGKRWVRIAPTGSGECSLLLAKASDQNQAYHIGNQTGGRVFLFLHTDDFYRDYEYMKSKNVTFIEEPREEKYGTVVVFKDLYGNKWDMIEPKS
jgi:catechol 2,3-dioxygenase-like lactoylglutathione lyase family enzyme